VVRFLGLHQTGVDSLVLGHETVSANQALALNEGCRWKRKLFSELGAHS